MRKEYFADSLSAETMAKMIDKTLTFEKNSQIKKRNINLLKIIPAAAAFLLVIGLANFIGFFNIDDLISGENSAEPATEVPAVIGKKAESDEKLTGLPRIVEKSLFESFLESIPEEADRAKAKMNAYYKLNELDNGAFYVFDRAAGTREMGEVLEIWNEYINWSDTAYLMMLIDYKMLESELLNPIPMSVAAYRNTLVDIEDIESEFALRDPELYAHVRFGENKNTLLLEIDEWDTAEDYLNWSEEVKKYWTESWRGYSETEEFKRLPEDKQQKYFNKYNEKYWEEHDKISQNIADAIREGKYLVTREVNGHEIYGDINIDARRETGDIDEFIAGHFDDDGYYIYNVYPYSLVIIYTDENHDAQAVYFGPNNDGRVYSKSEFDSVVKNSVIPYFNDLMEKGSITQEYYDSVMNDMKDPLDRAVERFFGKGDGK